MLAVFNRKEKTISCITKIKLNCPGLDVFLVDDNSIDGTSDAIHNYFPEVVVIHGSGNLFWGRGMHLAWEVASRTKEYDGYIWLNDDVELFSFGLLEIIKSAMEINFEGIVAGALCNRAGKVLYGGRDKNKHLLTPNGELQDVFYLNGNVVFVPKTVFLVLGNFDPIFHHHGGDYDYGLKAIRSGFRVVLSRRFVGKSDDNMIKNFRGRLSGASIFERFKRLYSPLGTPPKAAFVFQRRHFGLISAVKEYFFLHIINILPDVLFLMGRKIRLYLSSKM